MAARYDFRENPSKDPDGKPLLHPRIVSSGTIPTRQLLEDISAASTFTVGDLEGVLVSLTEKLSSYLIAGYHVELGQIGYFSASLKAKHEVTDKKNIRATSIYFDNVNFRASSWFRGHTQGRVERASKYGFRTSSQLSVDECKMRLERYLDENAFITRTAYTQLTGRLKNKALEDLKLFVNQGVVIKKGKGNQLAFVRPAPEKPML